MWFSAIAIVLGLGTLSRFVQFSGKTIETGDVKVLSYNVMHFAGNKDLSPKETADEIKNFLLEQKPDIICMQEVRLWKNSIFNLGETVEELDFINHYQFARSSTTFGSVTLSRFPIVNMGEIRFENSRNITIYTDLLIGSDTVRVFNVHLQSYQIDPGKYSFIESGVDDEKDLDDMREVGARFKKGFQLRAKQVRKIREYIDDSPYHVLVCGDFNDPPVSYAYRQLRKGLNDAFVESGSGIGRTYVGKLPSFRIDYIFHSPGFESYNFQTYDYMNSDHLPVSCSLIKN
ncbi:Metal-dependent hydrolase, endonuclease/exonuclease/phosphatase family [Tangfeifania diversioriginum]|uniref:Metal-dependent hydrolase, endonuclease/exonuclease/phosphatase family n=2 Tax=Tangfeifania diversioriginum TaxID=1168035 RepID=A0A1M6KK27_9BACT|nr:Metal-dependent hydrolase, endonuclease/exonuclease/phosphatase family [Tangfeifania diversioriginum]